MKLVLYDDNSNIIETFENVLYPVVDGNNVEWEGGSLSGINRPFCLLDDHVTVTEVLTDDIRALCLKEQFLKVDLLKENANLKARLAVTEKEVEELKTLVGNS